MDAIDSVQACGGKGMGRKVMVTRHESALADALKRATVADESIEAREAQRRWVEMKYDWDKIARQILEVYRVVAGR